MYTPTTNLTPKRTQHSTQYYYCSGPGNRNMKAVGALYAIASLTLLNEGPEKAGKIYYNL